MSDSLADQKKRLLEAVAIADQDFVDAHNALQWAQRIADEKHARQRRAAADYAVFMLTQEAAKFDTSDSEVTPVERPVPDLDEASRR